MMRDPQEEPNEPIEPVEPKPGTDGIQPVKGTEELDSLVSDMPKVVPDAIEAANNKEAQNEAVQKAAVDHKGRAFDPGVHATDQSGNPIVTPTGRFKRKLRLPGDRTQKPNTLNLPPDNSPEMRIKGEAVKWADTFIMAGMSIVGDEWKAEAGERESLIMANEAVFTRYGIVEIHPLANMGLIYGLYITKRVLTKPQTKSIFVKGWEWSKMKVSNFWLWVTGQKVKLVSTEEKK